MFRGNGAPFVKTVDGFLYDTGVGLQRYPHRGCLGGLTDFSWESGTCLDGTGFRVIKVITWIVRGPCASGGPRPCTCTRDRVTDGPTSRYPTYTRSFVRHFRGLPSPSTLVVGGEPDVPSTNTAVWVLSTVS